ncbi:MAG: class I SAM-dependent methyltransferase [Gammaproteobacteria bacterium]|nr:class I SAM-dependent methyltransferase [Gammaproteobacteria bacterium]
MSLATVDFNRLTLTAGMRVLDVGCGEGRHTLSAWLQAPVHAVGVDLSRKDLTTARARQAEFPAPASADRSVTFIEASALELPFADASFDVVICSEVLEHIFDHRGVIAELERVLRPGGTLVASVPRAWPERLCWWLSDPYHEAAGGHIRIFGRGELQRVIASRGFRYLGGHGAHALHVPYWWLRCAAGPEHADMSVLVRIWHRLLVWDLFAAPVLTRTLERWLDPILGKSVVCYFERTTAGASP